MAAMGMTADVRIPMRPLTVEDFERMVDVGILGEHDRVELLKGQLTEMSPHSPEHAGLVQWLAVQLIRAITPDVAGVRVQLPLRFVPLSEPEPDIAIVTAGVNTHEHPTQALLVIEIAMTSRALDLGTKAEVYAAAAVPEYWVIDISARTVHVHAAPCEGEYGSIRQMTNGSLRAGVPGAPEFDVRTLFSLLD